MLVSTNGLFYRLRPGYRYAFLIVVFNNFPQARTFSFSSSVASVICVVS